MDTSLVTVKTAVSYCERT